MTNSSTYDNSYIDKLVEQLQSSYPNFSKDPHTLRERVKAWLEEGGLSPSEGVQHFKNIATAAVLENNSHMPSHAVPEGQAAELLGHGEKPYWEYRKTPAFYDILEAMMDAITPIEKDVETDKFTTQIKNFLKTTGLDEEGGISPDELKELLLERKAPGQKLAEYLANEAIGYTHKTHVGRKGIISSARESRKAVGEEKSKIIEISLEPRKLFPKELKELKDYLIQLRENCSYSNTLDAFSRAIAKEIAGKPDAKTVRSYINNLERHDRPNSVSTLEKAMEEGGVLSAYPVVCSRSAETKEQQEGLEKEIKEKIARKVNRVKLRNVVEAIASSSNLHELVTEYSRLNFYNKCLVLSDAGAINTDNRKSHYDIKIYDKPILINFFNKKLEEAKEENIVDECSFEEAKEKLREMFQKEVVRPKDAETFGKAIGDWLSIVNITRAEIGRRLNCSGSMVTKRLAGQFLNPDSPDNNRNKAQRIINIIKDELYKEENKPLLEITDLDGERIYQLDNAEEARLMGLAREATREQEAKKPSNKITEKGEHAGKLSISNDRQIAGKIT